MAQDQQQNRPSLGQEMLSVFGIFAAVFLLLCLVSFSFVDASIGTVDAYPDNWGGKVGFFIAQVMLGFLGISSFWFIFLLFFFSFQFYSPKVSLNRLPVISVGCAGIIVSSSALFAAMAGMGNIKFFGHSYPAGGYLGNLLFDFFKTVKNHKLVELSYSFTHPSPTFKRSFQIITYLNITNVKITIILRSYF